MFQEKGILIQTNVKTSELKIDRYENYTVTDCK
jgi:hypothetical protein